MNTLTYKQAYDKITEAYIKGEIKPYDPNFCFCGTLCDSDGWYNMGASHENMAGNVKPFFCHYGYSGYKGKELGRMEFALLKQVWAIREDTPEWEDALFAGMSAALEVLKQIHIERGEIIDEVPAFTKRELV